jgi:dTDP-4-dehydrorhamnose reductase
MKTQPQFIILGASGMVGHALTAALGAEAVALPHALCDISQPQQLRDMLAHHHPKAVFNCAAITNVDLCEKDHDLADAVNTQGVADLARACANHNVALIHFSTDYVFNGSGTAPFCEDNPVHPINYYGQSKAASEVAVQICGSNHIIARVQWVFGDGRQNFIKDTAEKLKKGDTVRAFLDQVGSPSSATDIAAMVIALYRGGHRGTFHTVNAGHASRVEIAEEIARQLKVTAQQIIPVATADIQLPAQRPLNSRLSIDKIQKLGIHPPPWQDAVNRYLHEAHLL